MKKCFLIAYIIFLTPKLIFCQGIESKGIKFQNNDTWDQIVAKASAENKYIFVDCYATWCGPCKVMDQSVYNNGALGQFMNERFLSLKIQMDSTKNDNIEVKKLYDVARDFLVKYEISGYPTFLFFSPQGEIVHRGIGEKNVSDFQVLAEEAIDPKRQIYKVANTLGSPENAPEQTLNAAMALNDQGVNKIAKKVARFYITNILPALNDTMIRKIDNLRFLITFTDLINSKDVIFKRIYKNPSKFDSPLNNNGFSSIINNVITNEEINPLMKKASSGGGFSKWKLAKNNIEIKYGRKYAETIIIAAKINYFRTKKQWKHYCYYLIKGVSQTLNNSLLRPDPLQFINNNAYEIFLYSNDKIQLQTALRWQNLAIQRFEGDPKWVAGLLDTKANLLYKIGKNSEAINLEKKASNMDPATDDYKNVIVKMQNKKPTW